MRMKQMFQSNIFDSFLFRVYGCVLPRFSVKKKCFSWVEEKFHRKKKRHAEKETIFITRMNFYRRERKILNVDLGMFVVIRSGLDSNQECTWLVGVYQSYPKKSIQDFFDFIMNRTILWYLHTRQLGNFSWFGNFLTRSTKVFFWI